MNNKLYIIAAFFCCMILHSCVQSQKSETENSSVQNVETNYIEENSRKEPQFTIVPLWDRRGDEFSITDVGRMFAITDASGQYLTFDNDKDYSSFFTLFQLIEGAFDNYDSKENLGCKYRYNLTEDEIPLVENALRKIIDGCIKYLNGDKDKISDSAILEAIEKYYYDYKNSLLNYYCWGSEYNKKIYHSTDDRLWADIEAYNHIYSFEKYRRLDGKEVPNNAVIFK